jgi:hypothetical protein
MRLAQFAFDWQFKVTPRVNRCLDGWVTADHFGSLDQTKDGCAVF